MRIRTLLKHKLPDPLLMVIRLGYHHLSNLTDYPLNLRCVMHLRRLGIKKARLLILGTIPKSGRTYVLFVIANYLRMASDTANGPVTMNELRAMFPNEWGKAYVGSRKFTSPTPHLKLIGLDDLAICHHPYQSLYWNRSKVVHLYRNPLDYAVSRFFYSYEYRSTRVGTIAGPVEVMDVYMDAYASNYLSY